MNSQRRAAAHRPISLAKKTAASQDLLLQLELGDLATQPVQLRTLVRGDRPTRGRAFLAHRRDPVPQRLVVDIELARDITHQPAASTTSDAACLLSSSVLAQRRRPGLPPWLLRVWRFAVPGSLQTVAVGVEVRGARGRPLTVRCVSHVAAYSPRETAVPAVGSNQVPRRMSVSTEAKNAPASAFVANVVGAVI